MDTLAYDFSTICRACKEASPDLLPLFDSSETTRQDARIDEMLMACASIQVSCDDGLPSYLCRPCTDQLGSAYDFKKKCESTDLSLRDYLKSVQSVSSSPVKQELTSLACENEATNNLLEDINSVISTDINDSISTSFNESTEQPPADPGIKSEDSVIIDTEDIKNDFIRILENNLLLLTCRTCGKVFTTLDGLKCHKRIHTGGLFACKECGKQYTRQNHLQRHELTHGRRKVHVCRICSKTLTRYEHLKRHLTTHLKEKPFSCPTCNRGFNRSEHLVNHLKRCKGHRAHICNICNKAFNREDSLEVHKRLHDNKMPILPTLDNLDNIEEHYMEIDFDENNSMEDLSDFEGDNEDTDCFEPQINIAENTENIGEVKEAEPEVLPVLEAQSEPELEPDMEDEPEVIDHTEPEVTDHTEPEVTDHTEPEIFAEDVNIEDLLEPKRKFPAVSHRKHVDKDEEYTPKEEPEDSDSAGSEYFPTKPTPRMKRKRGRPRKNSTSTKGSSGRPRGRPPGVKVKSEPPDEIEPEGQFHCPICNMKFTRMVLLDIHRKKHKGITIHICTICNKKFTRSNHLKRHMMSHSTDKPFACDICTKAFNRRDHLAQHSKLHNRAEVFECDVCKRPFGRSDHLAKHKAAKHNIGEKVMGEKKFKCGVCTKGFTTEKYRDIHMKGHMGEKMFACKTCDKSFISKSHLTEHIKFHNDNSKKFLCSECGQRFIRNDYLVIHMRRHRGEKPFKCKFCGKGFPRTTDLTVHERYHTGEKTHLCTICGRGFGRAYNLTVHMRTHTGEKPYQCSYCDAAFAQGNDLKAHVRRHTGERFQCDLCSENFLMGYLLTQHKRAIHGLNVVSNIRRLRPVNKAEPDDEGGEPITVPLPPPMIPTSVFNAQLQAQLAVAHLQQQIARQ